MEILVRFICINLSVLIAFFLISCNFSYDVSSEISITSSVSCDRISECRKFFQSNKKTFNILVEKLMLYNKSDSIYICFENEGFIIRDNESIISHCLLLDDDEFMLAVNTLQNSNLINCFGKSKNQEGEFLYEFIFKTILDDQEVNRFRILTCSTNYNHSYSEKFDTNWYFFDPAIS